MSNVSEYIIRSIIAVLLFFIIFELILIFADYLSFTLVKNTLGKRVKNQIRVSSFWKIFGFANLSSFIGLISLFTIFGVKTEDFSFWTLLLVFIRLIFGPNSYPDVLLYISVAIFVSVLVNMMFNFFFVFRKVSFSKARRFLSSLIISILTAPYFFFVSFEGFVG